MRRQRALSWSGFPPDRDNEAKKLRFAATLFDGIKAESWFCLQPIAGSDWKKIAIHRAIAAVRSHKVFPALQDPRQPPEANSRAFLSAGDIPELPEF